MSGQQAKSGGWDALCKSQEGGKRNGSGREESESKMKERECESNKFFGF